MLKKNVSVCVNMKRIITLCYVVVVISGTNLILQYDDVKGSLGETRFVHIGVVVYLNFVCVQQFGSDHMKDLRSL
jgi:hypothetical protein